MGFQSKSNAPQKNVHFIQIKSEQDENKVITGKFFQVTTKDPETNGYKTELMKSGANPKPFFGYLIRIDRKLDATIKKKDGTIILDPHLVFVFNDGPKDPNEYHLKMRWTTDKGQVEINTGTLLNSLAGCKKFGYFKLSIVESEDKETNKKRHNIYLRNDINFKGDVVSFYPPKDGSEDKTKTRWMYDYKDIPAFSIKENIKGKLRDVDNKEEHQEFYLNLIDNHIQHKIDKYLESISVTKSDEFPLDVEDYEEDDITSDVEETETNEVLEDDDLPF